MSLLDGLVAYYPLENLNDVSGNGLTLTNNNAVTFTAGKVVNAANFVAASHQWLSHADDALFRMGDIDFTIAAWVNLASKGANTGQIAGKRFTGNLEYYLRWNVSSDRFNLEVSPDGANPSHIEATTFGSPSLSTWYFVVAFHDSVNNLLGISVNNGTVDTTPYSTGVFAGTALFGIGCWTDFPNTSEFWDGLIDEVAIYKRLLAPSEQTALYNNGFGKTLPFGEIQYSFHYADSPMSF
jgi:hypothetical protein